MERDNRAFNAHDSLGVFTDKNARVSRNAAQSPTEYQSYPTEIDS